MNAVAEIPPWIAAKASETLNRLEPAIAALPRCEFTVVHRFTPGLYIREIFMRKGSIVASKIHKTEHPFVISKGDVSVWSDETGVERLAAPYTGITKPGTRRALMMHEDTIWTTFHPTKETDLEKLEAELIEPHAVALDANVRRELVAASEGGL